MATANKTKIPVGTVIAGKYRVTREIGRGGMAAVYEAENVNIGKRIAIKVLAQELTSSRIVVERFLREARAAASIRSPYICDVYDTGQVDDGRPFLVLELLEGESLYERMTKVRYLDIETTVTVMTQTCRGLTKAHSASIVHRDLKPENIFLTKDEEGQLLSKILDFGLAKFYAPIDGGGGKQARLTREGAVFGTPAYMSPEQVRGQGAVDHRADLWALGCITYECLTGKTVWQTEQGVAMTFAQIANAPLPRPNALRPDLPVPFTAWFDRALDRNIEHRFQTAKEFAQELALAFRQGPPSFASLPGPPEPSAVRDPFDSAETLLLRDDGRSSTEGRPPPERRVSPEAPTAPPPAPPSMPRRSPTPPRPLPPPPPMASPRVGGGGTQRMEAWPPDLSAAPTQSQPHAAFQFSPAPLVPPIPPPIPPLPVRAPPQGQILTIPGADRIGRRSSGAGRVAVVMGVLGLIGGVVYALIQLGDTPGPTGSDGGGVVADASAVAPPASGSATVSRPAGPPPAATLPWMTALRDGQRALAADDPKGAVKLFKEALGEGGHPVPRAMLDDVQVALTGGGDKAGCRLTGLGRPRTSDLISPPPAHPTSVGRPSIAVGLHGPVVVWTEGRDNIEHVYAVPLDDALLDRTDPIDVSPEAASAGRPDLEPVGDRLALAYADTKGSDSGVFVRFLDTDGHAGSAALAGPAKGGSLAPSVVRGPDGSVFVAWSDESDAGSEDVFLRHVGPGLEVLGDVVRVTDFIATSATMPKARFPSIAFEASSIHLAFQLDREPLRLIEHVRVPLGEAGKGLETLQKSARADRTLGEVVLVNTDKGRSDAPSLSCGGGVCFLVWHGELSAGASAAWIEATKTPPLWRKKFARSGAHPAVAASADGRGQIVWYEGGRILTAPVAREGIGAITRIARITGDQPAPSIARGNKPGEWYLAWLDSEGGHLEAYAARVVCR